MMLLLLLLLLASGWSVAAAEAVCCSYKPHIFLDLMSYPIPTYLHASIYCKNSVAKLLQSCSTPQP